MQKTVLFETFKGNQSFVDRKGEIVFETIFSFIYYKYATKCLK